MSGLVKHPAGATPQSLTVVALNKADAAGSFRIYLGCSTRPFAGGGFMKSARAVPSKPSHQGGGKS